MSPMELGEFLGRMDEKLDILIAAKDDHSKRLRSLERVRWWALGAIAVSGTAIMAKLKALAGVS
jgi:hypothetical protein